MEKELNIAAILKDKPKGTKLWSPIFGECTFDEISCNNSCFGVDTNKRVPEIFYANGKYDENGECIIFPSKEMRDWKKFSWKKDDLLINSCGLQCIFKEWASDNYTKFNGCYSNSRDGYEDVSNAETAKFDKLDNNIAYGYVREIENRCGGKLNLDTLEIEKSEFKDGDILFVRCVDEGFIEIFKYSKKNGDLYDHASLTTRTQALDISGRYKICKDEIVEIRLATEEEKKQLFSALEKEGKAWDAEKKRIVELKPKIELKPFDKVLIRDFKDQAWQVSLFGYKDANNYYCCNGSCWNQCIPYEGNESLLGTTKDVEG